MKHLFQFSLLLLVLLLPATAHAHDFEVDGIYYNITGNEATVTSSPNSNKYTGDVIIPATVSYSGTTYTVTAIGYMAFYGCSGLISVTIPNSVISIGNHAFYGCSGLTSLTIPNSVTTIDNYAFRGCTGLTSIDIPNSVTSIGEGSFDRTAWYNNQPDGLVYAGLVAYKYKGTMSNGTSIIIKEGTLSITDGAFSGCNGLTSIDIPNSITTIGSGVFLDCSGLTSIYIPNSVTSIGESAFGGCHSLTSVYISDLEAWCNIDFSMGWEMPFYDGLHFSSNPLHIANHLFLNGEEIKDLVIPNSVTKIRDGAFLGCSNLTSLSIPNSVTAIGESAFCYCSGLTNITIGNSVSSIDNWAFYGCCSSLTNIQVVNDNPYYDSRDNCNAIIETASNTLIFGCMNTVIPNSVTSIGLSAFYGCSNLTSITIPNSVTTISDLAFYGCYSLTSITIPSSVTYIGNGAFETNWNLAEIYSFALAPPTICSTTFVSDYDSDYSYYYITTLYVPDIALEAYKVADYWNWFANIDGMPFTFEVDGTSFHATTMSTVSVMANSDEGIIYTGDVVIPDSVTYEGYTFAVTGIEDNAFDGCFELTSIAIPNSVETIGEQAFQGCTGLKSVTIGSGVMAIGAKAFNYCNALETVKCLGTVPPVMASADCFTNTAYNRATLLVLRQFVEAYNTTDYWYKFAHIDGWGSAGRGDIDGDGIVSINDVARMIDAILTGEHEGVYVESADLNANGRLDIGDVTTIIDMLLNDIE